MDLIKEFINKYAYVGIFFSVAGFFIFVLLSVITGNAADLSGAYDKVASNPKFVFWLAFLLGFLAVLFFAFFIYVCLKMKNSKREVEELALEKPKKEEKRNVSNLVRRKHNVLLVDDKEADLKELECVLLSGIDQKKIHIVCLNSLPDYCLAENFDIIISDIYGAGIGSNESIGALKAIKDAYPYKIVAAMSSITKQETKDKFDGVFLSKRRKKEIKDFVEMSIKELSNLEAYIKGVESELSQNHVTIEDIEIKRNEFLDYLERMKRFSGN